MTACGLNGIATGSPKGTLILSICHQPAKVHVRGDDTKQSHIVIKANENGIRKIFCLYETLKLKDVIEKIILS